MGKGKKSKKNEVAIAWYCEARHEMIYGLLKLAENCELDVILECDREDVRVVYFDEGQKMLTFASNALVCYGAPCFDLEEAMEEVDHLVDMQDEEEISFNESNSIVTNIRGEEGTSPYQQLTATVYPSGVRIDGTYGKICWINGEDLIHLIETMQEVQDQA